jgi:hypothetical protein
LISLNGKGSQLFISRHKPYNSSKSRAHDFVLADTRFRRVLLIIKIFCILGEDDWTQPAQEFIELFLFYYESDYYKSTSWRFVHSYKIVRSSKNYENLQRDALYQGLDAHKILIKLEYQRYNFFFESDQGQKGKMLYQYLLFFRFKKTITFYRKKISFYRFIWIISTRSESFIRFIVDLIPFFLLHFQ